MKEILNEEQRLAVEASPAGVILVRALAGSGKTRVLRHRVRHILKHRADNGQAGSNILLTAFNNSVAEELRTHFEETLSAKDFSRLTVRTCHGVATSLLFRFLKMTPIKAEKILIPKTSHVAQALQDHLAESYNDHHSTEAIRLMLDLEGEALAKGLPVIKIINDNPRALKTLELHPKRIELLIERMRRYRLETGWLTHNDTLPLANALPKVCFKNMGFRDVMADEMQDLNYQQRQLIFNFMQYAEGFTGVMDENQSVYGFQGSDANILANLQGQYPEARVLTLSTNYRSTDEILTVANKVLEEEIESDSRLVGTSKRGSGPALYIDGPSDILKWLDGLHKAEEEWSNTAILYRSRRDLPILESTLLAAKVPYALRDNSFFDDAVTQDIVAYLNLLYNPMFIEGDWRRIFNHYEGVGAATAAYTWKVVKGKPLAALPLDMYPAPVKRQNSYKSWDKLQGDLVKLRSMKKDPVKDVVRSLIAKLEPYWERLPSYGVSRSVEDRLLIAETFAKWVESFSGGVSGWDVVKTIQDIERGAHKNRDRADVLTIMTVHKAKGLEWKSVGIWNAQEGSFPMNMETTDHAEEKRLMYVAVTRARENLAVFTNGGPSILGKLIGEKGLDFSFKAMFKPVAKDPFVR